MHALALILLIGLILGAISHLAGRLFPDARFPEGALFFAAVALIALMALGRAAESWGHLIVGGWWIVSLSLIGYWIAKYLLRRLS